MKKYLILADDFTGASDTGVQLRKRGCKTEILISGSSLEVGESNFIVLDTETRTVNPEEAYKITKSSMSELFKKENFSLVYKKVDSTLRGNIIEEIKAILEVFQAEIVFFAPALPRLSRTTINGVQKIKGIRIMETEFARDPINPVKSDNIIELLREGFSSSPSHVKIENLHLGNTIINEQDIFYTFDAESMKDIEKIAEIGLSSSKRILWIGSAGLAEGIFGLLFPQKPSLGVVGSISEKTINQLNYAKRMGMDILEINVPEILSDSLSVDFFVKEAVSILNKNRNLILTSCMSREKYQESINYGENRKIRKEEMARITKTLLGEISEKILSQAQISGLFLTGGDTAISVIKSLKSKSSEIILELFSGIVLSKLADGKYKDLFIITKAGAFGEEESIYESLLKLKEGII